MKKIIHWVSDNILFVLTLFLLAFIPLYPKIPLLDVKNTWVYIRGEDFVVVLVLLVWVALLLRKKITLRTPLTMPILLFWISGAVATIHGVLLIFPYIANVFPNVAFLSFLRRIEYMSLFFVAFCGIKDKGFLKYVIGVLTATLFGVVFYGLGQKFLGFPAFLTMNEEFAKGLPIQLSALSRVPSTFAGHYDLAAYLVLVIPILTSLIFGFRNKIIKLILATAVFSGFGLLFMTVSRVSFFVLLIALGVVLLFQKKRFVLFSLPIIGILVFVFFSFTPALLDRFGNTIKQVDVLVDAKTGEAIGHIRKVPKEYFDDKVIKRKSVRDKNELSRALAGEKEDPKEASLSAIIPVSTLSLPPEVILLTPPNAPTGEDLPQGTGYINLSLSPVTRRLGDFFYEKPDLQGGPSGEVTIIYGDFLVKRVAAYDLSFTTRFQGEWPKALLSFRRNIFLGSGPSSVSLAVDNNYLRLLGEGGLLGFFSFVSIFIVLGIYIRKVLPEVDSPLVRSFVLGFVAGTVGLALNAVLIDVFEASKIAFFLWLLVGITVGMLHLYQTKSIDLYKEFKKVVTSTYAIILYLFVVAMVLFSPMTGNFFVGDDFTWFRWAQDCNGCIVNYFTNADGFFYRPGTKAYFFLMHSVFWLNQTMYHMVSIFLYFLSAMLVFLLAKKILRDSFFSALAGFLFLILSSYSEAVFWTAATGYLFNAVFMLLSLFFFIQWEENKRRIYFYASFIALVVGLLFHELGIVTPLLLMLYKLFKEEVFTIETIKKRQYGLFFVPILPYLAIRFLAGSHWFSGDYSYNLLKLPYNAIGNALGYAVLTFFGPLSLPFYETLRNLLKGNILFAIVGSLIVLFALFMLYKKTVKKMEGEEKKIIFFGLGFFIIALLPFLGLGNITSRYSYLASAGLIFILVLLIKKLYGYLRANGNEIALAASAVTVSIFFLLHIMQLQQMHSDWYEAGEKTKRFFTAIDSLYQDYWATEPMQFYFVNVPIRTGAAWVFPVGLPDALWLVFRNPNIQVSYSQSVEQTLSSIEGSRNEKVFEFDESGEVIERKKTRDVQ